MGRLEIQIRHGHDPGPSGAVIALAVLIALAVAGGAGHRALDGIAHTVLTVVEIAACIVGGMAVVTAAIVIALAVARRRALASRPRPARVQGIRLDGPAARPVGGPAGPGRGALDASRPAGYDGWPLPGRWSELPLDDRGGDGPARHS